MPQGGKTKVKCQLPPGAKSKAKYKKPLGLKKGARLIAPKKLRHMEARAIKRGLEKAINKRIEHEVTSKASTTEMKSLKLIGKDKSSSQNEKK